MNGEKTQSNRDQSDLAFILIGAFFLIASPLLGFYFYQDMQGELLNTLLPPVIMGLFGVVMLLLPLMGRRKREKEHQDLLRRLVSAGIKPDFQPGGDILNSPFYRAEAGGNLMIGGILLLVALAALLFGGSGLIAFLRDNSSLWDSLPSLLPLVLGAMLLIISLSEFYRIQIELYPDSIRYRFRSPLKKMESEASFSSFCGLRESILWVRKPFSLRKEYRSYTLIHPDRRWSDIVLFQFEGREEVRSRLKKETGQYLFPILISERGKYYALAPDSGKAEPVPSSEEDHLSLQKGYSGRTPFPGNSLRLRINSERELLVRRSGRLSLILGVILLIGGFTVSAITGAYIIMLPFGIISLALLAIGGRAEQLHVFPEGITSSTHFFGRVFGEKRIPPRDVSKIEYTPGLSGSTISSLVIEGDSSHGDTPRIEFAPGADSEDLVWLADRIGEMVRYF